MTQLDMLGNNYESATFLDLHRDVTTPCMKVMHGHGLRLDDKNPSTSCVRDCALGIENVALCPTEVAGVY
jgi:hypothetical protein